jgi:cytochrome c oxidase subunit 4
MNPVIAMSIACLKATLVVLFFMHLRDSDHVTWIVFGAAIFWLGILFVLILSDYAWRKPAIPGLG